MVGPDPTVGRLCDSRNVTHHKVSPPPNCKLCSGRVTRKRESMWLKTALWNIWELSMKCNKLLWGASVWGGGHHQLWSANSWELFFSFGYFHKLNNPLLLFLSLWTWSFWTGWLWRSSRDRWAEQRQSTTIAHRSLHCCAEIKYALFAACA